MMGIPYTKLIKTRNKMKNTDERVDWLQHIIDQKKRSIHEWQFVACTRNICDNMGRNPIDKLSKEIDIARELIEMCNQTHIY